MPGAVHIVAARIRAEATADELRELARLAAGLGGAAGVEAAIVGRSDEQLVTATWLRSRAALEDFAATPEHMTFVMRGLARSARGVWSAAVATEAPPPGNPDYLWAFAIPASDEVYEWQVLEVLADIERLAVSPAAGPTIEERERYRAAGVVGVAAAALDASIQASAERCAAWRALVGSIESALVPVIRA
jgi:hypothetical protein